MAGFHTKTFLKHDDYMTPNYAWDNIKHLIPKDKIIWEAFYGDGCSGEHLKSLGFQVIHEQIDFFENDLGDVIVSNPPFSKSKEVVERLKLLDKPFIVLLPVSKLTTACIRENFQHANLQIIIPRKRINFIKHQDGKPVANWLSRCNFDCFYYCWKIDLPSQIVWL